MSLPKRITHEESSARDIPRYVRDLDIIPPSRSEVGTSRQVLRLVAVRKHCDDNCLSNLIQIHAGPSIYRMSASGSPLSCSPLWARAGETFSLQRSEISAFLPLLEKSQVEVVRRAHGWLLDPEKPRVQPTRSPSWLPQCRKGVLWCRRYRLRIRLSRKNSAQSCHAFAVTLL
jgi:hypothetical protein